MVLLYAFLFAFNHGITWIIGGKRRCIPKRTYRHAGGIGVPHAVHETILNTFVRRPPNVTQKHRLDFLVIHACVLAIQLVQDVHKRRIVLEIVLELLKLARTRRRQLVNQHKRMRRNVPLMTHHRDNRRCTRRIAFDDGYDRYARILNGINHGKGG